MTTFLILLAALVLFDLAVGVRMFLHERPTSPPRSHREWAQGRLPSSPYALRH